MTGLRGAVVVTGTDTGVGKTVVACALLRGLRARGLSVGAMKPIETGVGRLEVMDGPPELAHGFRHAKRQRIGDQRVADRHLGEIG